MDPDNFQEAVCPAVSVKLLNGTGPYGLFRDLCGNHSMVSTCVFAKPSSISKLMTKELPAR